VRHFNRGFGKLLRKGEKTAAVVLHGPSVCMAIFDGSPTLAIERCFRFQFETNLQNGPKLSQAKACKPSSETSVFGGAQLVSVQKSLLVLEFELALSHLDDDKPDRLIAVAGVIYLEA